MSLSKKTKKWIDKKANISLKGKTVLVTGSNSGVGYKTIETMIYLGANVIMACRNMDKATEAKDNLLRDYPKANISIIKLDLASFESINNFVDNIISRNIDIDVFVNNAGAFHQPNKKTNDGYELIIGTNYLGNYYLSEKIIPYLKTLSNRVVYINTISIIYKIAKIEYDDFYYQHKYSNIKAYGRSKLCLARYTYDLANRCKDSNIQVYMNHPGITLTPLGLNAYGKIVKVLSKPLGWIFNSNEKSSLSVAYILSNNVNNGLIVGPNNCFGGWGYPKVNKTKKNIKEGIDELVKFTNNEINGRSKI